MAYAINQELCSACHRCRTGCPVQAITFRNSKYWIDPDKCISCGKCVKTCHNGCISDPDHPKPPAQQHAPIRKHCDVAVLGAGAAGLIAANKAQDMGKFVILLEKMHEVGGSSWYAGGFRSYWSKAHAEQGLRDVREEKYQEYLDTVGRENVDVALLKRMFEADGDFVDWLIAEHDLEKEFRGELGYMGPGPQTLLWHAKEPWYDAAKRIDKAIGPGEIGSELALFLEREFVKGGGELLLNTSAVELKTDVNGAICGVLAKDAGGEVEITCGAVVVATGAFSRNRELMARFQPMFYQDEGKEPVHIFTGAGATGDGITMCEALGADIDFKNRRVNLFGPKRHPYPCASIYIADSWDGLRLGSAGNVLDRAPMCEVSPLTEDPKWYCWKLVDDSICRKNMEEAMNVPPQSPGMDLPAFQKNWRGVFREEEAGGSIVSADTLPELAEKLGWDSEALVRSVSDYNERVKHPEPIPEGLPEFMKPNHDPMPIEQGPFYALQEKLFHENSIGGMTIDRNASVLKNGTAIPGLFAAGDTTRGIMIPGDLGVTYVEGVFTALTQAYCEGYIAGEEAGKY